MEKDIEKRKYERPVAVVDKADVNAEEAYSAAAVPAFAPAVEPVVWCGGTIAMTVLVKYC